MLFLRSEMVDEACVKPMDVQQSGNITIVSTVSQGQIIAKLQYIMDVINGLPADALKNRKMA